MENAPHSASVVTDWQGWDDDAPIERRDTGIRILLTLLFGVVARFLEGLIGIVVVFGLVAALITRRPPPRRLRELANRIVTYSYRIGRYLTYNESRVPFPFSEFPDALEPERVSANESESRVFGIDDLDDEDADDRL